MAKYWMNFIKIVCVVALAVSATACLDDDTETITVYSTIGNLEKAENGDYFINADSGRKLLLANRPSEVEEVAEEGDRLYAEFTFMDFIPKDYDRWISLHYVYKILVKDPVLLTDENRQEIGDDAISVSEIWDTDGYLNFRFQFYSGGDKTHYLNLVTVGESGQIVNGYLYVEFRHNANDDTELYPYNGIVSFRTDGIKADNPSLKGLFVRVKTYSSGEQFYKIDFDGKAVNAADVRLGTSENVGYLE